MTTILISTDSISTGSVSVFADHVVLPQGIQVVSTEAAAIDVFGTTSFSIYGLVHGDTGGILSSSFDDAMEIFVGGTGTVSAAEGTAIGTGTPGAGRYVLTNAGEVTNFGRAPTVWFSVLPMEPGVDEDESDTIFGGDYAITNTGLISNQAFEVEAPAIYLEHIGNLAQINNAEDGVIAQIGDMGTAIRVDGQAYTIIDAEGPWPRISDIVTVNAGEVYAEWYAYDSIGRGYDHLTNTGIMRGDVRLGQDADIYEGQNGVVYGRILGGNGYDTLKGGSFADILEGGNGNDRLWGRSGDDMLDGGALDDKMRGGAGDDTMLGDVGRDTMWGGAGDDDINSDGWADLVYGGAGDDTIFTGNSDDTARGGDGDDRIDTASDADLIYGGRGQDTIVAGDGVDTARGGDGDDHMTMGDKADLAWGGRGDDTLYGNQGFDTLHGGHGHDRLYGGTEADHLDGGKGMDTLTGGAGYDVFVFSPGSEMDRVTEFENGLDKVDVSAFNFSGYGDVAAIASAISGGVRLDFGDGDVLILEGIALGVLGASDFVI